MNKKIISLGIIVVVLLTFFTFIPCSAKDITCKLNQDNSLNDDAIFSTNSLMKGKPPYPPLVWTEDFSIFYIMIPGDPSGDYVHYYIDWGDGSGEWIGPFESDEIAEFSFGWWDEGVYQFKIKARNSEGDSEMVSYGATLSTDFKFFHPSIGYIGLTYKFTIKLEEYGMFIFNWGDGTYSDWNTGIAIPHIWNNPGEYSFRWKAKDEFGHQTSWSDPIIVEFLQLENQQPPNKTNINGPTSGKPGEELCWTFHSTDPDGDDIKYVIYWGDGTNEETDCYPSCTPVTVCHTYDKVGIYRINVRAQECPDGLVGPVSTLSLTIPRNRVSDCSFWLRFFDMFPILQKILEIK